MGGKKATSTSKVSIPPEVLARYNAVNARAEAAANTPFRAYGNTASDYVAQMNAQQNAGINDINATAGSYQPYMTQATQATQAGMGPAYEGIENYMSPYIKNVADTTGAYMRQQQEQAQSGALGTAAMSGAFGGDRAGIAAANLQQQNQMGYGKTMADIMNQGYTQALGASQADLARQLQGGAQMAGLGAQSQQLGLQGAQAKIAAGTMQQQTEQAGKDAMIQRFMQEQGYPFQTAQFLANIAMGTGAAQGSTTTTTTPRSVLGFADGGGVAGPRTYSQGPIGGEGYVPTGDLPVGQLMIAEPPQQSQKDNSGDILKLIASTMGAKSGGAIDQRHGYALDGGVSYPAYNTADLRKALQARDQFSNGVGIINDLNKDALMQAPTNPANMGLSGHQVPQSPMTGVSIPNMAASFPASNEDAARRAMMAKTLAAQEPSTNERYMLPTGLVQPPANALKELNFNDPYNVAATVNKPPMTGLVPPPVVAPKQSVVAASMPVPTPKEYAIGNDIYLKHPNGFITFANGERINPDMAESIRNEIDRQDRISGEARVMQGDEMLGMFRKSQEDLAQRNKDALRGMYQGEFPVPTYDMPNATPVGGVAPSVINARPNGVQQPMSFVAGAEPHYTLPTGLGTPLGNNLAPSTSPRPPVRPTNLGTPAVPAVDKNGVAGPDQTGIYTGVAGTGAGFVDLVRQDGSVEHRTGARNWRNNNPGNIEYGKLAQQYGAIGTDGRFAIFPDEQSGRNAMKGLLFDSGVYQGMTIASALNKYSPPSENDTEGKIRAVVAEIGLDPNTPLDQMTPQQRDAFTLAIQHTEGPMKGDVGASSPYKTSQVGGLGGADMTQQRDGLFNNNKPYDQRNMIGKFFHNPDGSLNQNAIMSLLSGIGSAAQAQTISPIGAILAGVGAGSDTYKGLLKQQADIALQGAQARRQGIIPAGETGGPSVDISGDRVQPLLSEMGGVPSLPYSIPKGMEKIFSSPQVVQGLQMDNQMVYPNSSPQSIAAADLATGVQQNYTTAKNTFTPVMSSFGAATSLLAKPGAGGAGFGADLRANMFAATNMVLSSLGMGPISIGDLADKKAILQKVAAAAAAAGQGNNPSVQSLMNALDTQGDAALPPEALASITAQNLVDRQMALEKGDFYQTWGRSQGIKSQTGNATYTGAEPTFTSELGQKYNAEKGFLEQIMLAPNQTKEQLDLREQLIHLSSGVAGGAFTPQAVQAAIKEAYPNAPDDLWKVFFNKGLAE